MKLLHVLVEFYINHINILKGIVMDKILDAGGRPIEMGGLYAYITSNNGMTSYTLGTVTELYYTGVLPMAKLAVIRRRTGYNETTVQVINRSTSTVKCTNLINVNEEYKTIL
jgi:hypothetical protein